MLKRILVAFENLNEAEQLIDYSEMLMDNYKFEIVGVYIKDIRKYEIVPPIAEGIIIDSTNGFAMREWEIIEEKRAQEIKELFLKKIPFGTFIIEEGIGLESIIDKMRAFDLLLIAKGEIISSNLKTILKFHMKPLIIVPKLEDYSIEQILLLDDNGARANGALNMFLNTFTNKKKLDSLTIGKYEETDEMLLEYYRINKLEIKRYFELNFDIIKEYNKDYNLFIMGNLRYNFLIEKLTGKFGVKILQNCNTPIFIG